MMGAFQGLMGALFVRANLLVVALRDRHIPATRPGRRMMEARTIPTSRQSMFVPAGDSVVDKRGVNCMRIVL
jgi:hypothetical protein